jgi:hypothetical protein
MYIILGHSHYTAPVSRLFCPRDQLRICSNVSLLFPGTLMLPLPIPHIMPATALEDACYSRCDKVTRRFGCSSLVSW